MGRRPCRHRSTGRYLATQNQHKQRIRNTDNQERARMSVRLDLCVGGSLTRCAWLAAVFRLERAGQARHALDRSGRSQCVGAAPTRSTRCERRREIVERSKRVDRAGVAGSAREVPPTAGTGERLRHGDHAICTRHQQAAVVAAAHAAGTRALDRIRQIDDRAGVDVHGQGSPRLTGGVHTRIRCDVNLDGLGTSLLGDQLRDRAVRRLQQDAARAASSDITDARITREEPRRFTELRPIRA
jgi:hypothetical protein